MYDQNGREGTDYRRQDSERSEKNVASSHGEEPDHEPRLVRKKRRRIQWNIEQIESHRRKRISDVLREDEGESDEEIFSDDKEQNKIKNLIKTVEKKKYKGRTALCVFAIILLWTTSFAVCRALIRLILDSPSFEHIEKEVIALQQETVRQQSGYKNCVLSLSGQCNVSFQEQKIKEISRYTTVLEGNADHLNSLNTVKSQCSSLNVQISDILKQLDGEHLPSEFRFVDAGLLCTDEAVDEASARQAKAAEAVRVAENTQNSANDVLLNFQKQVDERRAYDEQYFGETLPNAVANLSQQIQVYLPSMEELEANLTAPILAFEACFGNKTVFDAEGEVVSCDVDVLFRLQFDSVSALEADFENYLRQLESYKELYEDYEDIAETIVSLGDVVDRLTPAQREIFDYQRLSLKTDRFESFPPELSTESFQEAVIEAREELNAKKNEQLAKLAALYEEISAMNQSFINNLTVGYEQLEISNVSVDTNFAEKIAEDLEFVPDTTIDERVDEVFSNADQRASNLLNISDGRNFSLYNYPEKYYTAFKTGLMQISDLGVLFDTIWRILQSVLLIRKYWSISGINTPPADMVADDAKVFSPKQTGIQTAVKIITNPLVILFFLVATLISIVTLIYIAYNPLYSAYVEGCIKHSFEDIPEIADGTMIFRNVLSIAKNYASREGDELFVTTVDTLNAERELTCRDYLSASLKERDDQQSNYLNVIEEIRELEIIFAPYAECINWTAFDNEAGTLIAPLIEESIELECDDAVFVITSETHSVEFYDELALYQCQDVSECDIACPGVSGKAMAKFSFDASCTAEWGLHSYFLIGLLSFFMYICLNISRHYIMRGVIAAFYKSISLDIFSYQGSCHEDGYIVLPAEISADEYKFRELLRERLRITLRKFQLSGWFEMLLALSMNLPWIVFLIIVAPDLRYEGSD
eukprot:snap_masked-scaffold_12-processed-gene-0.50-mRNA-1 protein AED:1.00 eAED:1.00 QI:0/-1/0/0/-1/1/1/0/930